MAERYPKTIRAEAFCSALVAEYSEWLSMRGGQGARCDRERTESMLGSSASRKLGNHGIIGKAATRIDHHLRVTSEDLKFDQIWWYFINSLSSGACVAPPSDWHSTGWYCGAVVEHENDPSPMKLIYDLRKLFVVRATLKAYVGYPASEMPSDEGSARLPDESEPIMRNECPDASESNYVLCMGPQVGKNVMPCAWSFYNWSAERETWSELKA